LSCYNGHRFLIHSSSDRCQACLWTFSYAHRDVPTKSVKGKKKTTKRQELKIG
jgi:hypothetical protein